MNSLYYAYLSGIHPTLPLAELQALLEAIGIEYRLEAVFDQVAVFRASRDPVEVARLAAYIHEVGLLVSVADADPDAIVSSIPLPDACRYLENPFRVEVTRVKGYRGGLDTRELAKRLGTIISKECRLQVDFRRPASVLRVLVTEGVAVIGIILAVQDRRGFQGRRQDRRPFFRSVALDPRLSRLFINLSRPRPGKVFVDPFCGTGGFAIEAALEDMYTVCSDLDGSMVEGSLLNLDYYGLRYMVDVVQADATAIPVRSGSVSSIGTDPPYGRQAPVRGALGSLVNLLEGFITEASRILGSGGYVSFASPHWVDVDRLVKAGGLQLVEKHFMRVHGSLTRVLTVARKGGLA